MLVYQRVPGRVTGEPLFLVQLGPWIPCHVAIDKIVLIKSSWSFTKTSAGWCLQTWNVSLLVYKPHESLFDDLFFWWKYFLFSFMPCIAQNSRHVFCGPWWRPFLHEYYSFISYIYHFYHRNIHISHIQPFKASYTHHQRTFTVIMFKYIALKKRSWNP